MNLYRSLLERLTWSLPPLKQAVRQHYGDGWRFGCHTGTHTACATSLMYLCISWRGKNGLFHRISPPLGRNDGFDEWQPRSRGVGEWAGGGVRGGGRRGRGRGRGESYFQTLKRGEEKKGGDKNHNNMRSGTQFGVRLLTAISITTHNPVTQYHYWRPDKLLSR